MKMKTVLAIRTYNATLASAKGRYRLACKHNRPDRFEKSVCLFEIHPRVQQTYKESMREMRLECASKDLWYKSQLLKASLGLISPLIGPSVWAVNGEIEIESILK